jgi:hypothetical protein
MWRRVTGIYSNFGYLYPVHYKAILRLGTCMQSNNKKVINQDRLHPIGNETINYSCNGHVRVFLNNNNLLYYSAKTMVKHFLSTLHHIKQEDKL